MSTASEVITQHALLSRRWVTASGNVTEYISAFAGDVARKRGPMAASQMFYPMITPRIAEPWVKLAGSELRTSSTYQISSDMCEVITSVYRKSTEKSVTVSISELPSERGFCWLDTPPALRDRHGRVSLFRAVSWALVEVPFKVNDEEARPMHAIRLITWADTHLPDEYSGEWDPGVLKKSEREIGRLQLQHTVLVPLDQSVSIDPEENSPETDDSVAWVHGMFMLLGTTVAARSRGMIPKSTAGEVKKLLRRPEVTVITLRRAAVLAGDEPGTSREVDWSCRWVVRGHNRHISGYTGTAHHATPSVSDHKMCSVCSGRITWVAPFVKGPSDAPMRETPVLHRLSR